MADYVVTQRVELDDGVTSAAANMTAGLNKVADAFDGVEASTTRGTKSATTFANQLDPVAAATRALTTAIKNQNDAAAAFSAALAKGAGDADSFARAQEAAGAKVDAARARLAAARVAASDLGEGLAVAAVGHDTVAASATKAASAHDHFSLASAGALRELLVLGHEAMQGNFSRFGGSLFVLAERSGGLVTIFETMKNVVTSVGGQLGIAAAVGVGALTVLAVEAEHAATKMDTLADRLRVTRDDYASLGKTVDDTAKQVGKSGIGVSTTEAFDAGQTIASAKRFSGDPVELQNLIGLAARVAKSFGEDIPKASLLLVEAINDPNKAAKQLADEGFRGIDDGALRNIASLQAQGRVTEATAIVIKALDTNLRGAKEGGSVLDQAVRSLHESFTNASGSSKSFGEIIGEHVLTGVASLVLQLKDLLDTMHNLNAAQDGFLQGAWSLAHGRPAPSGIPTPGDAINQTDSSIRDALTGAAGRYGIDSDLLARLQLAENRAPRADGTWAASGTGPVGPMQVAPSTAANLPGFAGRNVNDPTTNIDMGSSLFAHLLDKYGDPYLAVLAYHDGETLIDKMLNGSLTSKGVPYQASAEGIAEASKVTAGYSGNGRPVGGGSGAMALPEVAVTAAPRTMDDKFIVGDALKTATGGNTEALEKYDAEITKYVRALGEADKQGGYTEAQLAALREALEKARAGYANALTPIQAQARATQDSLTPLAAAAGAARDLASAQEAVTLAARAQGRDATPGEYAAASAAAQTKLTAAFNDQLGTLDRSIAAQDKINAAYSTTARGVVEATNATTAAETVRKTAVEGSAEYVRQLGLETDALNKQSAAKADANTLALSFSQKDQLETIRLETSLIGAETDVRDRELAVLKERQRLIASGGPSAPGTATGAASLARVAEISSETDALKRQQSTFDELANVGSNAFDQIGNAITTAFANGTLKTLTFAGVVKAAFASIAQEALKLAIINPVTNALFGTGKNTLSDVGGIAGALFGSTTTQVVSNTATVDAASSNGIATGSAGTTAAASGAATAAAGGGIGVLGGAKVAYDLGKLVFSGGSASVAESVASGITGLFGNATAATNLALDAAGQGVAGVATASQVAVASVAEAAGASASAAGTAASALSAVSSALPYIGAGVTLVTELAQGNFKGAALTAAGAAIGTLILPGVGTAVGAAVGALAGSLFASHPKNPFESVDVNISNGQVVTGAVKSQLENADGLKASVDMFAAGINSYMSQVGLKLANADGRTGIVSDLNSNKDVTYTKTVGELFKNLRFTAAVDDGSNFAIAKAGALPGQQFDNVQALSAALTRVASFSDGLDTLGLQLKSVGNDLVNIQIAGLKNGAVPTTDLQTAFAHDLPGQSFANVDAFMAEVTKINNFVNGTIPSLLDPVFQTTSQLQTQIVATIKTYQDAIAQAKSYGLATDGLTAAQGKAIALLQVPALKALAISNQAIQQRDVVATGGDQAPGTLAAFDLNAKKQRDDLVDQFTNIYGSLIPDAKEYGAAALQLDKTLADERLALIASTNKQLEAAYRTQQDATLSVYAAFINIRSRQDVLGGNSQASDLNTYNLKAIDETKAYSRQLLDFYGASFASTADYQNRMTELETVQQGERLAIAKKYADAITAAQNTAAQAVSSVIVSLDTYARGLQTSALSPLSPQNQLGLARSQFNAVAGAAGAGDYKSLTQVQGYADSFLNASRAVNGSGSAYVADYQRVLDALGKVAAVPPDTLTASYQASLLQQQTDTLVTELRALRAEVAALRLETQQGSAAPARVAA